LTERYGVNQVIWYATSIAKLAARLDKEICPGLPAKLQDRIRRRAWKVVKLYTHATEVLRSMAGSPVQQAAACDLLVRRIGHSAWRFVGTKT